MKKLHITLTVIILVAIAGYFAVSYSKQGAVPCEGDECIKDFIGIYVMKSPGADASTITRTLRLLPGGTVSLESEYSNNRPVISEIGSWFLEDEKHINVIITGQAGEQYHTDDKITFERSGGKLTAISYDQTLYGSAGLIFTKIESYQSSAINKQDQLPGRDGDDSVSPSAPSDSAYDPNATTTSDHGGPVGQPIQTSTITLPYGEVVLSIGGTAQFKDLAIRLSDSIEDSRCATGVQCVWAGTVNATLDITTLSGTVTKKISLRSGTGNSTEAILVSGVNISLKSVTPYPTKDKQIKPSDYRLTFDLSKK